MNRARSRSVGGLTRGERLAVHARHVRRAATRRGEALPPQGRALVEGERRSGAAAHGEHMRHDRDVRARGRRVLQVLEAVGEDALVVVEVAGLGLALVARALALGPWVRHRAAGLLEEPVGVLRPVGRAAAALARPRHPEAACARREGGGLRGRDLHRRSRGRGGGRRRRQARGAGGRRLVLPVARAAVQRGPDVVAPHVAAGRERVPRRARLRGWRRRGSVGGRHRRGRGLRLRGRSGTRRRPKARGHPTATPARAGSAGPSSPPPPWRACRCRPPCCRRTPAPRPAFPARRPRRPDPRPCRGARAC